MREARPRAALGRATRRAGRPRASHFPVVLAPVARQVEYCHNPRSQFKFAKLLPLCSSALTSQSAAYIARAVQPVDVLGVSRAISHGYAWQHIAFFLKVPSSGMPLWAQLAHGIAIS